VTGPLLGHSQDRRLRGGNGGGAARDDGARMGPVGSFVPTVGRIVLFIGVAVKELPPLTLAALRVGLAALILWASAPLTGAAPPRNGKALAALALLGLGNNALPFALIAWGQTHLAAGLASILNAATPLFAVLVAHVFTAEEKLSRFKIIGTAAGMAGVAWVIGPDPALGASEGQRVGGRRGALGGAELRDVGRIRETRPRSWP
jgi:drug/metabolite transporter (DMT)-like permease